ncbi:MAG: NAD(P)H-hydrate dehydratase [Gammaproteobacteria bacterium]
MDLRKTALYQTHQLRQLEQLAVANYHLPETELMERAGAAAVQQLRAHWPEAQHITVVCGRGNNAGDGYVVARLAKEQGLQVTVWQVEKLTEQKNLAQQQAERCQAAGVVIKTFSTDHFSAGDVIVDALLGIGLHGEVQNVYRQAISTLNRVKAPVLALDIPSGLAADTGRVAGEAIYATFTVTFIAWKLGLFIAQGPEYCGEIILEDLGLPQDAYHQVPATIHLLTDAVLAAYLPKRRTDAHKGDFGHVLVIGGDYGMAGAVRMTAEAAARTGAGLVSVATHADHVAIVSGNRPELMCHAVNSPETLLPLLDKANVIAIGPGLGQSEWSKHLLAVVLDLAKPKVIDADAINLLAKNPTRRNDWILTPHPGEAARLLQTSTQQIQADRLTAVRALQRRYGGVAVLKGAGTMICAGENEIYVCAAGNPGMASGGMGDVLTGIIAGLLAQGLSLSQAAQVGVYLHARAGDEAARHMGERGLLALDLMPYLWHLVNWR